MEAAAVELPLRQRNPDSHIAACGTYDKTARLPAISRRMYKPLARLQFPIDPHRTHSFAQPPPARLCGKVPTTHYLQPTTRAGECPRDLPALPMHRLDRPLQS